jgi:hypothetical protein
MNVLLNRLVVDLSIALNTLGAWRLFGVDQIHWSVLLSIMKFIFKRYNICSLS